jgi:sodium/proline symporter
MVLEHTPAVLGGILLAGALAAMMSTADSQLLVASSAAAEDIYTKVFKKSEKIDEKDLLRITRFATIIIGALGLIFAFTAQDMVYTLVSFSATGLFSAFGPAMTLTFFWGDKVSTKGIITAFLVGPLVTILWITLGLNAVVTVRLIAPPLGFIAAIAASLIWPREKEEEELEEKMS